jgi:hypothetical protein
MSEQPQKLETVFQEKGDEEVNPLKKETKAAWSVESIKLIQLKLIQLKLKSRKYDGLFIHTGGEGGVIISGSPSRIVGGAGVSISGKIKLVETSDVQGSWNGACEGVAVEIPMIKSMSI